MLSPQPERPWSLLWVALGASLWGADTLLRRPLTHSLTSAQIVLIEHLILTVALLPVCWRARGEMGALAPRDWGAVLGIAWGGSALATVCFTEAIKIGNPSIAVLLQKLQPVFTALLARLLLKETLGRRFWAWLLIALAGGWLISFGDELDRPAGGGERLSAALLALAAAALWGASTVLGRLALSRLTFLTLTALRIFAATPLLLLMAWISVPGLYLQLSGAQVLSLLLMALIPGLAALLIYYRGLSGARASRAGLAELAYPATAALLNWRFLGARLSPAQLAGFALLWAVILRMERRAR